MPTRLVVTVSLTLVLFLAVPATAGPITWADNGHVYDFVTGTFSWSQAKVHSEMQSYGGVSGHLVTITSAAENSFLVSNFGTGQDAQLAWTGGHEPDDDGVWTWNNGPEVGIQYSYFATPTGPANYANWGGIEPNDHAGDEDYMSFVIGNNIGVIQTGQWADSPNVTGAADPIVGYLVEFEPNVVPLPSAALAGLGLLGLLGAVRRYRRRRAG